MRFYIRASEYSKDDIDFFELSNAYCHRVRKYIFENDPKIIPASEYGDGFLEDFLEDPDGLQKIFKTKQELIQYLKDALSNRMEEFKQSKLDSALYQLDPVDEKLGSDRVAPYVQSTPYAVCGYDINTDETPFEDLEFKDPRSAIIAWFEQTDKHPMGVCIDASTIKDAQNLLKWVVDNEDQFRTWYNQYDIPYKLEHLINYCKKHQNDSNLIAFSGDQVEPFSLG